MQYSSYIEDSFNMVFLPKNKNKILSIYDGILFEFNLNQDKNFIF
jgi:hypothetical protein